MTENNLLRAYKEGMSHGRNDRYDPPRWLLENPNEVLWITAYQQGHREGQRIWRAEKTMGKGERDA